MYIPEFWCGVAATIATEIALVIVYAIYSNFKSKGGKENE